MPEKNIVLDDLHIDLTLRQVHHKQQIIHLSKLEFNLLYYLAKKANEICPYEQLLADVWNCPKNDKADIQLVRLALCRLRKQLHTKNHSIRIVTVRGVGVYLSVPKN